MGKGGKEINRLFIKKSFLFVSLLNFTIVMKGLNLQDHQAKTHDYMNGLAFLKTGHPQTKTKHYTNKKNEKKKQTLKQKIIGDYPTN